MSKEQMSFNIDERVSKMKTDYDNAVAYQSKLGITKDFPKFVRFYEGKQWPKPTKNTQNLPRPVINFTKMICRNKKSAILAKRLRLVYKAENTEANVEKFNEFAAYIMKELGQEALDKQAIDDAVKKGPYCYHYYWDMDAIGKDASYAGALRGERIDPLNILFANPREKDEQKQKWIIIVSREEVNAVKAKADEDLDTDAIKADESDDPYNTAEQDDDKLCTVFTRYFRIGGEVYYEKATKTAMINKPTPLAPDIEAAMVYLGFEGEDGKEATEDAPNNSLPDGKDGKALQSKGVKAPLYPIVVGSYEQREGSIYGIGEVEGLVPNQKAVNFQFAMSLLNSQELAWGKYVVHPDALKGQVITNEPAQVIIDYTRTGKGVAKMQEQPLHGEPTKLATEMIQLTRSVTGASEVMSGEVVSASMSGAAIAQLQAQASQPIEDLADNFRLVKEKQGRVIAQFLKLYYFKEQFVYEREEPKLDALGQAVTDPLGNPIKEKVTHTDTFSSVEFQGVDFDVIAEAISGTKSSAAGDIQLLDALFTQGKISFKSYIKMYPDDALSNKQELIRIAEEEEASVIAQLSAQVEQLTATLGQYESALAEQQRTVDSVVSVIQENNNLKQLLAKLYVEAQGKINLANEQIKRGNAALRETTQDASDFAVEIARRMQADANSQTVANPI